MMQILEGKKGGFRFIRYDYDSINRKSRQITVTEDQFTDAEKQQFEEYKQAKSKALADAGLRLDERLAVGRIKSVAETLTDGGRPDAEALFAALDELKKAMRKAGYKQPAKKKSPATVDSRQLSIQSE